MRRNIYIIFTFALLSGCLKDDINVPVNVELESNAELLRYFEEQGDYIDSPEAPSLIDAAEVYANPNSYLIVDVRTNEEFINGHIEGAKNISNAELLIYIQDNIAHDKIIIVSANGQASAYYTCLLRLYGFNNIYSLKFGMAYWNQAFSGEWLQKIKDSPDILLYDSFYYPKGEVTSLPSVFEKANENISVLAKQRISEFITRGFVDKMDDIQDINIGSSMYLVCYGSSLLYDKGHPPNTILYVESAHLKSVKELQTLPTDKEILIYDYNGQLSAAVTAYLQVMGYKAKSLLFGANQLIYYSMIGSLDIRLLPYAFIPGRINNFPYVTGL